MNNEKENDILKTDLILVGAAFGVLGVAWWLGRRSGYKDAFVLGKLAAYESVVEAIC